MADLPKVELAPGVDPVDSLTIPELRIGNAKLRADLVEAITGPTADRWDAMAIVGWLHTKRRDPAARLETWTAPDVTLSDLLAAYPDATPEPETDTDQPTPEAADVPSMTVDELGDLVSADPLAPTPSPPSPEPGGQHRTSSSGWSDGKS